MGFSGKSLLLSALITTRALAGTPLDSPECQAFQKLIRGGASDTEKSLKTDGLVVMKDGKISYEFYDRYYDPTTPHCLWSVSKSISTALLGTAVLERKMALDDRLSRYFPETFDRASDPYGSFYRDVKISDLIEMGSGFQWEEDYGATIQTSSVVKMLYLDGHQDMARFALSSPMRPEGPGGKWTYSSGDTNILMGALKKAYGSRYESMPWRNLFKPIGMRGVVFERDASGTFLGASYAHASPREMAKFGQLYLNDGVWNGKRILPEGWVAMSKTVSSALLAKGTPSEEIISEGVYGRGFWLNQRVRDLPLPFPNAPQDLFFAAGLYGQIVAIIPSQRLVIARTGRDKEYWSKLDPFFSLAAACFSDRKIKPGTEPPGPSEEPGRVEANGELSDLAFATGTGLITRLFAKEICSCHFISGIPEEECFRRDNLSPVLRKVVDVEVDEFNAEITVKLNAWGKMAGGTFSDKVASAKVDRQMKSFLGCAYSSAR